MTIIIVCYNNKPDLELSLESIRNFNEYRDINVVVVDNGSDERIYADGEAPSDITYIYMDEGKQKFGKLINIVVEALNPDDDLLIMSSPYCVAPNTISNLSLHLNTDNKVAVVGGCASSFGSYQLINSKFETYSEYYEYCMSFKNRASKNVLSTDSAVILVSNAAFHSLNGFCEQLITSDAAIKDFCLRALTSGWKTLVADDSVFWSNEHIYYRLLNDSESVEQDNKCLESIWGTHYFNICGNINLIGNIEKNSSDTFSILEIGCDCGATLLEIKNKFPNSKIYGTDISEPAVKIAAHFSNAIVNNIEEKNIPFDTKFDFIIFGDVLEHLRNPQAAIKYCKSLLSDEGKIIASIPNVMHISVMEQLLNGNFTYTETGLLDKTHIHLFTYNEIVNMFNKAGYIIENISITQMPISQEQSNLIDSLLSYSNQTERFMYEAFQYQISASQNNN